jgi:hypothetical protein
MNPFAREHAKKRAAERYGNVNLGKLLRTVRDGKAKFVCFGHQGRLIYDVPSGEQVIRVLVDDKKSIVISVLPNEFRSETRRRDEKKRKQDFFKHFENDEEAVALP